MKIRQFVILDIAKRYRTRFSALTPLADALDIVFTMGVGIPSLARLVSLLATLPILIIALLVVLVLAAPWTITFFWEQILIIAASPLFRGIAVFILLITSFLLYLARTYMRPIFGLAEVAVGIATCWGVLSNPPANTLLASLAVVGGVYIMVRGFDNIVDEKSLTAAYTQTVEPEEQGRS